MCQTPSESRPTPLLQELQFREPATLTAQPELGQEPEKQGHAVLGVGGCRVDGEAAGLQQPPDADHHHELPEHAEGRAVTQEAVPGAHRGALRGDSGMGGAHTGPGGAHTGPSHPTASRQLLLPAAHTLWNLLLGMWEGDLKVTPLQSCNKSVPKSPRYRAGHQPHTGMGRAIL